MTASPDIEVLIPHHGGIPRLRRALDALRAQTLPPAVCVIDDASPDESARLIPAEYPEVRYLRLDQNVGFGSAVNRGIASSAARLLILLNNDTVADERFVELVRAAHERSGAETVAACLRRPDGSVDSCGIELDRSLVSFDAGHGEPYEPERLRTKPLLAPSAGAGAYLRSSLDEVGGFDEEMFAYLEDVDLGIRLRLAGARCEPAPEAFAWHEHSATLGSGTRRKNERMGQSRGYLLWKYRSDLGAGVRLRGALIDLPVYAGQIVIDRNAGAVRGRLAELGRRRAAPPPAHPGFESLPTVRIGIREALRRRLARRR